MHLEYVENVSSYSLKKTCHQRKLRQTKRPTLYLIPTLWNIGILHNKQSELPKHLQHSVRGQLELEFDENLLEGEGLGLTFLSHR